MACPLGFELPSPQPLSGYAKSRGWGLVTKFVHNMLSVSLSFLDGFRLTFGGHILRFPIM